MRVLGVVVVVACLASACARVHALDPAARPPSLAGRTPVRWVVIAPHPDDETLTASGVLRHAVETSESVAVVVVTNGDFDCRHDGLVRQGETVNGLAALGVPEERVYFLGYPDGELAHLGLQPLPLVRRRSGGTCALGNTTYGGRGVGRADYHRARTGLSAIYTRENAVSDLTALLRELAPVNVVVTHPDDTHSDHLAAYGLFREALDRLPVAPRVHRAIVHNGDCWPVAADPHEPCPSTRIDPRSPTPPLSGRLSGYVAPERLAVPTSCLAADRNQNPKLRAIAAHTSQTRGTWESYLFGFARSDEPFYPETFERHDASWHRSSQQPPLEGKVLDLTGGAPATLRARLPLALTADLERPATPLALHVLGDDTGAYRLEIDPIRREARLYDPRRDAGAAPMRVWALPHDLWSAAKPESLALLIEARPDEGDVAEISLSLRGAIVGVAIDVEPRRSGEWLMLDGAANARVVVHAPPSPP